MAVNIPKDMYKTVCRNLQELEQMKEDLERAERVGNPHVAQIRSRYEHCKQRLESYKAEYFPGKK